jgi:dihydroorotate dehydrogenase electron transfer subunit
MDARNAVLVAGGYGAAPLAFLAEELVRKKSRVTLVIGAQTEELLVFGNRFKNTKVKVLYCTDDGSAGKKGFVTGALQEVLAKDKTIDMIYACGPEVMMGRVIELSDEYEISCEISLERYMKCGFGVCGQCCVDGSGARVCVEGPVFDKSYVKEHIIEFGRHKRDGTGTRVRL